jgi:hypothetical protein
MTTIVIKPDLGVDLVKGSGPIGLLLYPWVWWWSQTQ